MADWTGTNATSFQRFCCFNREFNEKVHGEITSRGQIINTTKVCFADLHLTMIEQLKIVIHFSLGKHPYKTEDCATDDDLCTVPTTLNYMAYICFWVAMLLVTVSSNFTVMMAVQMVSYLRESVGNILISSLALSDMLVGIFIVPIKIVYAHNNMNFCSKTLCRFYITVDTSLFSISITNLFFITIDRYVALNHPYKYQSWMSSSRSKRILVAIWIFGFTWGLLSNFNWSDVHQPAFLIRNYQCLVNNNSIYTTTLYVLVFYIPALVMAFIYSRIYGIARHHARAISESVVFQNNNAKMTSKPAKKIAEKAVTTGKESPQPENGIVPEDNSINLEIRRSSKALQMIKYRKSIFKATKTVATVYGTFFVCWFPVSALSLALAFCRDCFDGTDMKWFYVVFVEILPVVNSMMNPFIYAVMNTQYRKAYKTIFQKLKRKIKH